MKKNITIIGGGPAGLYAAFYAGLRDMSVRIIEANPEIGGKINIYEEKTIWDLGGVAPSKGYEVKKNFIRQGLHFNPEVILNKKIVAAQRNEDGTLQAHSDNQTIYESDVIIIATGTGIIKPHRLHIQGASKFETTNLHYTVSDLERFKNKKVVISGGSDSAMDWSSEIADYAEKVYLCFRRDELTGFEYTKQKLLEKGVMLLDNSVIEQLNSKNGIEINSVILKKEGELMEIDVDDVIINHGYEKDRTFFKNLDFNISIENDIFIRGESNTSTGVDGVYAIGDIVRHPTKSRLLASCINDAANAVNLSKNYISPNSKAFGKVSSHNKIFNN